MSEEFSIWILLLITSIAFAVPLLTERVRAFRVPHVVAEILAGMIIGRAGLGLVHPEPWLSFLSFFGFSYLMFISGLEIDVAALVGRRRGREQTRRSWRAWRPGPLLLALAHFAATVGLAYAVAVALGERGLIRDPVFNALMLSTTSLGVVVPVLKERGAERTRFGQTVLAAATVADFLTLILLTAVAALAAGGATLQLLLILILFAVFAILLRLGRRFAKSPVVHRLSGATSQIRVRGALALIVIFLALAQTLGVEAILGAFLAGLAIGQVMVEEKESLRHKLEAIGFGFFIPIFFIMVGAGFDLWALFASPRALLLTPLLLMTAFGVKLLPALLFRPVMSWRETSAAGLLLSARLSLIIAAAAIGLRLGFIDETINSALILTAIVSSALAPVAFARVYRPPAGVERERILVVGANETAILLARRLRAAGKRVTLVDDDPEKVAQALGAGEEAVQEPATRHGLAAAGAGEASVVVAVTGNDQVNLEAARLAAEGFGVGHRIAVIQRPEHAAEAERIGVRAVMPGLSTILVLENLVHNPESQWLTATDQDLALVEVAVQNPAYLNRALRDIAFPERTLVVAVRRGPDTLVPHGDTCIEPGDVVVLAGDREDTSRLAEQMRG